MAEYPAAVYSPRTKENLPGVIYVAAKTTIGYAEDVTKLDDEVVAVQTEIGTLPKWASASVKERLKGIRSLNDADEDVIVIKNDRVGIGTASPRSALDLGGSGSPEVGSGIITGGPDGMRMRFTGIGAFPRVDFIYTDGGKFRAGEVDIKGTNDIFFQGVPITDAGYTFLESWDSAGLILGTGGNTAPVYFQINRVEKMRIDSSGNVGIGVTTPDTKLRVAGAIASASLTFALVGPTDDLDVSGVNTLFINAGANAVTIGGFVGGVDGQILNIVIINPANDVKLEHAEGGGDQDILLHAGADETIDGHYGGWTLICHAGVDWHDASHSKHV